LSAAIRRARTMKVQLGDFTYGTGGFGTVDVWRAPGSPGATTREPGAAAPKFPP